MEEYNISTIQEGIQNLNHRILVHIIKPEYIPVDYEYIALSDVINLADNYYTEIVLNDSLDYLSYNDATSLLDKLVSKLTEQGHLIIQSTDLKQFASAISFGDIDLDTAKVILYPNKRSIYTMHDIETEVKNRGMVINEKKYINMFEYFICAIKQ